MMCGPPVPRAQSPQLSRQVGPGPPLAALPPDGLLEGAENGGEPPLVGRPAAALALLQPVDRRAVPALAVAPPARGDLVLQPRRAALDPRDHVLGRGPDQGPEGAAAPDAGGAGPIQDPRQAVGPVGLGASPMVRRKPARGRATP